MAFIRYRPSQELDAAERVADPDNIIQIHAIHPRLMRHHFELYRELMHQPGSLSRREREILGVRVSALNNRVPPPVLWLEVAGAALALGLLAFYLSLHGRGLFTVLSAACLITLLLLVTFDLDRPTRGLIRVPTTALTELRVLPDRPVHSKSGRLLREYRSACTPAR